jgi:hypothetical protein
MDQEEVGLGPPPSPTPSGADKADDLTINDEELFAATNFKSGTSGLNERGRGAFAAAALCLLEQLDNTSGHIHVERATGNAKCERWQLNRMPGRTDACLLFVNSIFGPMLGLKAFPSWRSLARSLGAPIKCCPSLLSPPLRRCSPRNPCPILASTSDAHRRSARTSGDTRDYLPLRHWKCLELKGGGISNSTKQPWQPYRCVPAVGNLSRPLTAATILRFS